MYANQETIRLKASTRQKITRDTYLVYFFFESLLQHLISFVEYNSLQV